MKDTVLAAQGQWLRQHLQGASVMNPHCISNRDRIPDVPVDGIWYFSGAGTNNSANKYRHM